MREAFRRPTRDGVRDPRLDLLGLVLVSPAFLDVLVPLHYPPHWPCAFRRADPKKSGNPLFWPPKSHPKFHSIFEGILAPKMVPKASQNGAKTIPKSIICSLSFSYRFFFSFWTFFC